jgi:hypothetical protein
MGPSFAPASVPHASDVFQIVENAHSVHLSMLRVFDQGPPLRAQFPHLFSVPGDVRPSSFLTEYCSSGTSTAAPGYVRLYAVTDELMHGRCFMPARVQTRLASISIVLLMFLIGIARNASAAPIELENDANISWSDSPCFGDPIRALPLCNFVNGEWRLKPDAELLLVNGAPRLVPDASNAGNLLQVAVDFLGVSLDSFAGPPSFPPGGVTPLFLNVFDVNGNPILRPGGSDPLQLTHFIAPSPSLSVEATDFVLNLGAFVDFGLLPPGDVIFTVSFNPHFGITDGSLTRPDRAAIITLSGAGTVVPEPSTLLLSLAGLAGAGLATGRRRLGHRTSKN